MPLAAAAAIVRSVRDRASGAAITLDTHEDWRRGPEVLEVARLVDVFVPSREELAELVGYDDPSRAAIELTGAGNGPRLTVLAGVHGCEYAPMAAVRQWTRALAERELRGNVCAVPVLNVPAFRARTPVVVPDDDKGAAINITGKVEEKLDDNQVALALTARSAGTKVLSKARAVVRLP